MTLNEPSSIVNRRIWNSVHYYKDRLLWILIGIAANAILMLFEWLLITQIIVKENEKCVTCRIKQEFSL
jgi:hypothetical protein